MSHPGPRSARPLPHRVQEDPATQTVMGTPHAAKMLAPETKCKQTNKQKNLHAYQTKLCLSLVELSASQSAGVFPARRHLVMSRDCFRLSEPGSRRCYRNLVRETSKHPAGIGQPLSPRKTQPQGQGANVEKFWSDLTPCSSDLWCQAFPLTAILCQGR